MVNFWDMTASNQISSLRKRATLLTLMMMTMVAGTLFAAPSLSMAQQQQHTNTQEEAEEIPLTLWQFRPILQT
jgi:hypothetical protein